MKKIDKYLSLISVCIAIVGVIVAFQISAYEMKDKIDDITTDLAEHNIETGEVLKASNQIIISLNTQAIHQGYLKEAVEKLTLATKEQTRTTQELNRFLERNRGYFEISKNGER